MELVLKEVNGYATQEITDKDGKVVYKKGQALNTFAHMTDDGKTAGGCWIYTGVTVEGADGKLINKANLRKPADDKDYLAHGWGFAWPANRRILYNRASADLAGKPWSEKKKLIWWDPEAPGQEPDKKGKWVGLDVPDFNAFLAPDAKNGDKPFIMRADLVGAFFGPLNDGPVPGALRAGGVADQEPPVQAADEPGGQDLDRAGPEERPGPGGLARLSLRHHHVSPHRASPLGGHVALPADARRAVPLPLRGDQPRAGRASSASPTASGSPSRPRAGKIHVTAMVTHRLKPFMIDGKKTHQIGVPWHWGYNGISKGDITNDLSSTVGDPTVYIQETKAFLCNVKKGEV